MTEVAGNAALLIPLCVQAANTIWAKQGAAAIDQILLETEEEKNMRIEKGIENAKRFDAEHALDQIDGIYKEIVASF